MIFLPKKVSGTDPLMGEYYTPSDVRPLMIVNTDNRLIANAMRHQWEPIFEAWISKMQQGFLPGRSMASNVIDVESWAQQVCLEKQRGAILLLDFRAAFPSVSHGYLHQVLEALGIPEAVRAAIRNLYCEHKCQINFADVSIEGFNIGAGIRQGCPLSPLLFALVVDVVLRRIKRLLPSAMVRAFADDIALAVDNLAEALPILQGIFQDLEKVAGLALNKPKCVLIPLWPSDKRRVSRELATHFADWAQITVNYSGTYLGVVVGPESGDTFWDKAVKKYLDRAKSWGQLGLGLYYSTQAYCTYVLPVLSFLAQFRRPNDAVWEAERKALSLMVPGPYLWCRQEDYYHLGKKLGQAASFPRLEHYCLAARTRLYCFENHCHGGLRIDAKHDAIQHSIRNIENTSRLSRWFNWFQEGSITHIHDCREELNSRGLVVEDLKEIAAGRPNKDQPPSVRARKMRKCFQRTIRGELDRKVFFHPAERMRHKLDRWNLPGVPARTATRCARALQDLKDWVPPRICSAVLRTQWNGWCTRRRFQQIGRCCLGCTSLLQEDSIEHYAVCPISVAFAKNYLRIRPSRFHLGQLVALGTTDDHLPRDEIVVRAIWAYALYRTHNLLRNAPLARGEGALDVLKQFAKEGVLGHAGAAACLDNRWAFSRGRSDLRPRAVQVADEVDLVMDIFD